MALASFGISAFETNHPDFSPLIGSNPTLDLLIEEPAYPFAHEAGVYLPSRDELWITSNIYRANGSADNQVTITKVILNSDRSLAPTREVVPSDNVPLANGGVNYRDGVLFCSQGNMTASSTLVYVQPEAPYATEPILTDFYERQFNSLNDVIVHSDGSIWFTDPTYGFDQGNRPPPDLPSQVYRFDPSSGSVRAVADAFGRPNGLSFSPDETVLYVSDTDQAHGNGNSSLARAATIYAFDVADYGGHPSLINRRLFAYSDNGIPDGIKTDEEGNVYSGCREGVHVWSPGGDLLGKILVEGGAANFAFGRSGEMFILNENRLWRAQLDGNVRGALLGI